MNSSYLERILLSCKISNGYFMTSQISHSTNESRAFFSFRKRNPDFFNVIYKGKSASIYQTSPRFYFRFGLDNVSKEGSSKIKIIQNLTWFSFCLLKNTVREIPDNGIEIEGKVYYMDDFSDSILNQKNTYIVSLPFRETSILTSKNWAIIPSNFYRNYSEECLKSYFFGFDLSLGENCYWPKTKDECHKDLRTYSGVPDPISGAAKFEMDKSLIKSKVKPKDYSFGIYKI